MNDAATARAWGRGTCAVDGPHQATTYLFRVSSSLPGAPSVPATRSIVHRTPHRALGTGVSSRGLAREVWGDSNHLSQHRQSPNSPRSPRNTQLLSACSTLQPQEEAPNPPAARVPLGLPALLSTPGSLHTPRPGTCPLPTSNLGPPVLDPRSTHPHAHIGSNTIHTEARTRAPWLWNPATGVTLPTLCAPPMVLAPSPQGGSGEDGVPKGGERRGAGMPSPPSPSLSAQPLQPTDPLSWPESPRYRPHR